MSVAISAEIGYRPYRGYDDPGLPNGVWVVHASVLGDASGGLMSVNMVFKAAANPNSVSRIYSLDQLGINTTESATEVVRINPGNWDVEAAAGSTGALALLMVATVEPPAIGSNAGLRVGIEALRRTRWFLGQPRKNSSPTTIEVDGVNVNATSLSVFMSGYWWGAEAVNAPGGPRRPVDGLFS